VLAEMQLSFGNSSGLDLLTFAPGGADFASGSGSYSGSLDLTGLGIAAGADGKLRIEFSEGFKDFGLNVAEGQWVSGTLTFDVSAVPEPASAGLMLLGLGLVAAARRTRRG
jgi:autotransporter translocation and assembly factor TamB